MAVKPGYKQTEVGVIPEDWELKALQDVFTLKSGFAFSSEHFSKNGPIVLTPGNFLLEGGLYFEDRNTKRYSGAFSAKMIFSRGDLLIVMTDLTPDCNLLGKPAVVQSDEVILHNQRIGKVVLRDNSLELPLLFFMLLSRPYLHRIRELAVGSTVRHTSNKSIYSVQLPWPPLPEQRDIAKALSDMDALLGALKRLIAKKHDLKQATMQQLLTGQIRLPGFDSEWEVKTLGEVFAIKAGRSKSAFVIPDGDYWIVDMGSVSTAGQLVVSKQTNFHGDFLRVGDLVMPKDDIGGGSIIGKVGYINADKKYVLGDHVYCLRAKEGDSRFLAYLINSHPINRALRKKVIGSAQLGLGRRSVNEQEISFPNPAEQTAIADVLTDMDAELTALEQRLAKTRGLKQGMMQELLTGRTRLV